VYEHGRRTVLERDDYACRFCGIDDDQHREEDVLIVEAGGHRRNVYDRHLPP
jgi:hypothetical protein